MARRDPWVGVWMDAWTLGVEASAVVGLRAVRIAAGGTAGEAEARRMVEEKLDAALALQAKALTGGLGLDPAGAAAKTLSHYRRRVRANHRRLVKG